MRDYGLVSLKMTMKLLKSGIKRLAKRSYIFDFQYNLYINLVGLLFLTRFYGKVLMSRSFLEKPWKRARSIFTFMYDLYVNLVGELFSTHTLFHSSFYLHVHSTLILSSAFLFRVNTPV